jgi:hypothetical protein
MSETWQTYRQALAGSLGFHLFSNQSSTGSAAATNQLVIPDLIDSNLEPNFLDSTWEYQATGSNGGEIRRTLKAGLAPATGTVTLSRAHTAATTANAPVEFFGVLPPVRHLGRRGLLEAANLALKECWTIDTLNLVGGSSYQYSLSAYPWVDAEDAIIDVAIRRSGDVRDGLIDRWRFVNTSSALALEFPFPFSPTDTLKPIVYRPLDTWIQSNGTWADSTAGLSSNGDQALLSVHGMLAVGLYYCYDFLASEGDPAQRAQWRALADRQRTKANKWKDLNLPHLNGRDIHWGSESPRVALIGNGVSFDAGLMDL